MNLHHQVRIEKAESRLRAALDKPIPPNSEECTSAHFDPWDDLMDGCIGVYNSDLDRLAVEVLEAIRDRRTFELLKTEKALAAELFMHMLCVWLCDYGTSPRGAFPASGLDDMWQALIDKWRAYADAYWSGEW